MHMQDLMGGIEAILFASANPMTESDLKKVVARWMMSLPPASDTHPSDAALQLGASDGDANDDAALGEPSGVEASAGAAADSTDIDDVNVVAAETPPADVDDDAQAGLAAAADALQGDTAPEANAAPDAALDPSTEDDGACLGAVDAAAATQVPSQTAAADTDTASGRLSADAALSRVARVCETDADVEAASAAQVCDADADADAAPYDDSHEAGAVQADGGANVAHAASEAGRSEGEGADAAQTDALEAADADAAPEADAEADAVMAPLTVKAPTPFDWRKHFKAAVAGVKARWQDPPEHCGFTLVEVADALTFRSNPRYAPVLLAMRDEKPQRLSRPAMETLAIIAYRQPVTKPESDHIRGVDCGGTIKMLLDKNLIRIVGKKEEPGRPLLYGTGPEFLSFFNLANVHHLPSLRAFDELNDDGEDALRQLDGLPSLAELSAQAKQFRLDDEPAMGSLDAAVDALRRTESTSRDALAAQGISLAQDDEAGPMAAKQAAPAPTQH